MNSSFDLLHVQRVGNHFLYDVEFIIDREIQSLLTIEIVDEKIQGIICCPVDSSARIKHIMNDRRGCITTFIYGGEYFPEDRIIHMLDRAIDEYDEEIEGDL